MNEKTISEKIRLLRLSQNISLNKMAELTGMTKGYLSKIERSETAPPFPTLEKIAVALGVDITSFFIDHTETLAEPDIAIIRDGEGKKVIKKASLYKYEYEALAYLKAGKNMEPLLVYPAFEEEAVFSHDGEEFMYVLAGTHELTYNGKKYVLKKGDSVYFDARLSHTGRSLGKKKAKLLTVIYTRKK